MSQNICIAIETKKFPVAEGESEKIVNEGMFGKLLCQYLEKRLPEGGIDVPFFVNEDWGWWVEVRKDDLKMGLRIYSDPDAEGDPERYAIMSSITDGKKWSWRRFRRLDVSDKVAQVMNTVEKVFANDGEIARVSRHDDYPFD